MRAEFNSEQEVFWSDTYAKDYINKNNNFDKILGIQAWKTMLRNTEEIHTLLECGCNIGRNIMFLNETHPEARKSIIEISSPAYEFVTRQYKLEHTFNGAILNSSFDTNQFDLVFTIGVLIHIAPNSLLEHMEKIYEYSRKYILMGEYFNRTPVMLEYQGQKDRLFKRDFGKLFIETFKVRLVDYGFLWGHQYDKAGFDDITWWVFERK